MASALIELRDIGKTFGTAENQMVALAAVNLSIQAGEFVAIVGQSGSGKSTLMNILGALDTPTTGQYFLAGEAIGSLSDDALSHLRLNKFGFIFQRYNLLAALSVIENVALPAVYQGRDKTARIERAKQLLSQLGLGEKQHHFPNQLSGGQQQRVSIARALMNGGEIILADEPTGALDSQSGEAVLAVLTELNRIGHSIILITHDAKVAAHAGRIIEIADGKIISDKSNAAYQLHPLKKTAVPTNQSKLAGAGNQLREALHMATRAIDAHKMRALLTMLGIIIGICAVSLAVALGKGTTLQMLETISSLGTNTISIYAGANFGDVRAQKVQTLQMSDADALGKFDFVSSISPEVSSSGAILYQSTVNKARVSGVAANYASLKDLKIAHGRFFNAADVAGSRQLAVVDGNTAKQLFGVAAQAIGKLILYNKIPLKIIGVASMSDAFANNRDMQIWAPYSTVMQRITGGKVLGSLTVKIDDTIDFSAAEKRLGSVLERRHQSRDFFMLSSDAIRESISQTTRSMTMLIAGVAILSLIVGGIGVMNIMLVSVTERTREIGIRMAIGARGANIRQQFLLEAALLCLLGGGIGVVLAYIIGRLFNAMATEYSMVFSPSATLLALVSSSMIGIVFGYTPAKRAAKLQPITALARE